MCCFTPCRLCGACTGSITPTLIRRHHRAAFPPGRDPIVDGDQDRRGGPAGRGGVGGVDFEVLLNATAMWSHSNLRLPLGADRLLRHLFVTPDMHRVHHSIVPRETHSNFGFNLALWDRLFGTYRHQPEAGHEAMTIGIPQFGTSAS
jgi:hypothetical protein